MTATTSETDPITTGTPFGAPHDFKVTGSTVTSMDLAWTEVDRAVGYRISYYATNDTLKTINVGAVTSTTVPILRPGITTRAEIAAVRSDGTVSSTASVVHQIPALTPPSDFRVTKTTSSSVTLAWTKVPGVPKYRIYHRLGSGTRYKTDVGNVDTVTIKGLRSGRLYWFQAGSMLADGRTSPTLALLSARTN
jgi:hypothetical protein